jgi:replicative DNA helicase
MDADEILFKCASHLTGIDSQKISGGQLGDDELRRVEQAMLRIRNSPLRIYTPDGITPSEFVLYAREAVMERRTEIFCVDYAQMVGPDPEDKRASRYEQLGTFAYAAKQKVARALDTSVVCMAQLKRDAAQKEEPTPEDMGDSYELVRAADFILLINETETASEAWVGKNRQGPGGVLIPMRYDKPTQTFHEDHSGATKTPDYRIA